MSVALDNLKDIVIVWQQMELSLFTDVKISPVCYQKSFSSIMKNSYILKIFNIIIKSNINWLPLLDIIDDSC